MNTLVSNPSGLDSSGVFAQAIPDGRAAGKRRNLDFVHIYYFCSFFGVSIKCGGVYSKVESESSYF